MNPNDFKSSRHAMLQGGAQAPKNDDCAHGQVLPKKFGEIPAAEAQRHGKNPEIGQSKIYRSSTWMIAASIKIKTFSPR
jgi:hypothetical protein